MFAILNNDQAIKYLINHYNDSKIIELHQVKFTFWSVCFKTLKAEHQTYTIELDNACFAFKWNNRQFSLTSLNIHSLKISEHTDTLTQSKVQTQQNQSKQNNDLLETELSSFTEYLPEHLFVKFQGFSASIDNIHLSLVALKQHIEISELKLRTIERHLVLSGQFINQLTGPIALEARVAENGSAQFSSVLSDKDFIKFTLNEIVQPNKQNASAIPKQFSSRLEIKIGKATHKLLKHYLPQADALKQLKHSLTIDGKHTIESQTTGLKVKDLLDSSLHSELSLSTNGNYILGEWNDSVLPFSQVNFSLLQNIKFTLARHGIEQLHAQPRFSNTIEFIPNQSFEHYSQVVGFRFLSQLPINLTLEAPFTIHYQDKELTISEGSSISWGNFLNPAFVYLKLNSFQSGFESAAPSNFKLDYTLNARLNKHLSTQQDGSLSAHNLTQQFSSFDFELNEKKLASTLSIKASKTNKQVQGTYKLNQINVAQVKIFLNQAIHYLDSDLEILSGKIDISGNFDFNLDTIAQIDTLNYSVKLDLNNLNIDYDDYLLNGIQYSSTLAGKGSKLTSVQNSTISIKHIVAGIELKNLKVDLDINADLLGDSELYFTNLNAQLFGGSLQCQAFQVFIPYNPYPENPQPYHTAFIAQLDNIQLSHILALADNPEIIGSGILNGTIPFFVDEKLTLINGGSLKNKGSGYIQYKPDSSTRANLKANPHMALLIEVLGHLEYRTFKTKIDLDDRGKLLIESKLKGVNPDFHDGYPIEFNPKIELDFEDMIRSMQIGNTIGNTLDKRAKQKMP